MFQGNNPYNATVISPSVQVAIPDASSTLTGTATLGVDAGSVQLLASGDSITLARIPLSGHSMVTVAGGGIDGACPDVSMAEVELIVWANGVPISVDTMIWMTGEPTLYETYRVVGEYVTVRVTATDSQTATATFFIALFVASV